MTRDPQIVTEVVDGVCAKGAAGACMTVWLGNLNLFLGCVVAVVTIGYVAWKWRVAVLDRRSKNDSL